MIAANNTSRENNFDLLRLFAAFQVLFGHTRDHLDIQEGSIFSNLLQFFPGVLMFFTISGYLIYAALDRNNDLKSYFYNRWLRLYPALWVCFLITMALLFFFRIINAADLFSPTIIAWIFAQLTFLQFWTPEILRSWGLGIPNGSLWTITVEIQFYILLPLLLFGFRKIKMIYKIILFFLLSVIFNQYLSDTKSAEVNLFTKVSDVSIFPYLYSFLAGSMMYLYREQIKKFIAGKALYWLLIFITFCLLTKTKPSYFPHELQIISNLLLSIVTISLAFTKPRLGKILKANDISYGLYIYHMLVINSFVSLGWVGEVKYFFLAILITTLLSCLSWFLLEKKVLKLKRRTA